MTANKHPLKKIHLVTVLIPILFVLLFLTACNGPVQDPGLPSTSESTQSDEGQIADSPLPPTDTTAPPTETPTATPLPTLTSTLAPIANISANTNCRTGPGSVYDLLHTYLAGDEVVLHGKNPNGFFWYTSDSAGINPDCWLWTQYATPVGDTAMLPVFTPPPTPTLSPDFEITFFHADVGAGQFHFFFEIENTGNVVWDSALLYIYDPVVWQDAGRFSNTFQVNGTLPTPTKDSILVGDTGYFHSGQLSNPGAYGKEPDVLDIYFIACTQEYLGGYCASKTWSEKIW